MNRLTKLALRLVGVRVKRREPPPCTKVWSGPMDDYNELAADGLLDSETMYNIFGSSARTGWILPLSDTIDITTIDGPSLYHPQRSNTMLKFELKQKITHKISGRTGIVYGRAEYVHQEPSYLVYWDGEPNQSKEIPNEWCSEGYLDII